MSAAAPVTGSEEVTPARKVDRAELGVAVLLAVVGVVVIVTPWASTCRTPSPTRSAPARCPTSSAHCS